MAQSPVPPGQILYNSHTGSPCFPLNPYFIRVYTENLKDPRFYD